MINHNGKEYEKEYVYGDFSVGSVVRMSPSHAGGMDLIPVWGTKIPHASKPKNKMK